MLEIAKKVKSYSINIVPEKREELTTEGGLDIINMHSKLSSIIEEMHSFGIKVSLFIFQFTLSKFYNKFNSVCYC